MTDKKNFNKKSRRNGKSGNFKKDFKKDGNTGKVGSDEFLTTGNPKGGCNDIAWWNENPQLLKDAASLSYAQIAGLPLVQNINIANRDLSLRYAPYNISVPGIMVMEFMPIIGLSKDGSSAVNNASRLLYSWLRHANSGSRNYEQSDLMTYVLATANLLVAHAELVRLYGIAMTYSKTNRYVGKSLIEALGYNFDNVVNNLAALRYGINELSVRINSLAIPKAIHLYARHISLVSHVFKDASTTKAQLYVFKPAVYYKWSAVNASGEAGSSLKPVQALTHNQFNDGITVDRAINFVTDLLDALVINEDCGLMSGDMLKAIGENGVYHIASMPENYAVLPIYDEVMLSQIHNSTIVAIPEFGSSDPTENSYWVTQSNNNLIFDPTLKSANMGAVLGGGAGVTFDFILDSGMEVPTPEFTMEATRLMCALKCDRQDPSTIKLDSVGTELIVGCKILRLVNDRNQVVSSIITTDMYRDPTGTLASIENVNFEKFVFDWAPITYMVDFNSNNDTVDIYPLGELFNYTTISSTTLARIHSAALLSVLNVYSLSQSKA